MLEFEEFLKIIKGGQGGKTAPKDHGDKHKDADASGAIY